MAISEIAHSQGMIELQSSIVVAQVKEDIRLPQRIVTAHVFFIAMFGLKPQ
jgi:hypothetical protein